MTDEWTPERLRALADERAGDGPSGPHYDPELLDALTNAADQIEAMTEVLGRIAAGRDRCPG